MKCPFCNNPETKVLDKRDNEEQPITRRRRECLKCEKRFTTYERVEDLNIIIIKKDGTRQQFDRQKVRQGIIKSCEKRPVAAEQIDKIVDEIEAKLREMNSTEIPSREIGEIVMKKLRKTDKIAYIRFASVYREFADVESFEKELEKLLKRKE